MSKKSIIQFNKNIDLSSKLLDYVSSRPKLLAGFPVDACMVIIPANDKELLESNEKLIDKMVESGKSVVKATSNASGSSWKFSVL
jgi:hypothetical protein